MFRRILGILILLTGLFGVVLGVGCASLGQETVNNIELQLVTTLDTISDSLNTTRDALLVAKDTLDGVNTTVDTVSETAVDLAQTINQTTPLLAQVSAIASEDIPDSLETVEETLPNVAVVAGTVDDTLSALSEFGFEQDLPLIGTIDFDLGIEYDPEVRFDESINTLAESLDGIPEQLRGLKIYLNVAEDNLLTISTGINELSTDLDAVNDTVAETPELLDQYIVSINDIQDTLVETRGLLQTQLNMLKGGIIIVAVWFVLVQLAPLYLGWELLRGRREPNVSLPAVSGDETKHAVEPVILTTSETAVDSSDAPNAED